MNPTPALAAAIAATAAPGPSAKSAGRRALAASVVLHVALAALALGLVARSPPRASSGGGTRVIAVTPDRSEGLPEEEEEEGEQEGARPAALPEPPPAPPLAAVELPEVVLEPEPLALAAEPVAAPEPAPAPEALLELGGRRVRPPAAAPAAAPAPAVATPVAPTPAAATPAGATPAAASPAAAAAPGPLVALRRPDPTYPPGLSWSGELVLRLLLLVEPDGALGGVVVDRSTGLAALDRHVAGFLARHWRFAPLAAPRWVSQTFRIPAPL